MKTQSSFSDFALRLRQFMRASLGASHGKRPAPDAPAPGTFEELARALFALQFHQNEPFRRLCQARKVSPEDDPRWFEIPPMPTKAFKELAVTCLPESERTWVFHSSGTTVQRPSRHFHTVESLALYEASLAPWFARHLLPDNRTGVRILCLTPPPVAVPHSSLAYMFETVRREFGERDSIFAGILDRQGAWALDWAAALAAIRQAIAKAEPLILLGTAFNFVQLLDYLSGQGIRLLLPPGSRVMETGGYKGKTRALDRSELHALITDRLGVSPSRIVCEYGMSELSSQAYDRRSVEDTTLSTSEGRAPRVPRFSVGHEEDGDSRSSSLRRTGVGAQGPEIAVSSASRLFRFPPWARAQVISPETGREVAEGETGLLRVFDLANVWSVMAVQTEDLGVRRGEGFELIGRSAQAEPRGCSMMISEK